MIDKNKDQEILDYIKPNGKLIPQRCLQSVHEKRGWYNYLMQRYDNNTLANSPNKKMLWREILYRLANNIEEPPRCKTCGKVVPFYDGDYATFCSKHCANIDSEVLAKNKAGVTKGLKKVYEERKEEIQAKRAKTLNEKYGENTTSGSPFELKQVREIVKNTVQERYGVDNVFKLKRFRGNTLERSQQKWKKIWKERGLDIDYGPGDLITVHNACPIHGDVQLLTAHFHNRLRPTCGNALHNPEYFCLECHPLDMFSSLESSVAEFLSKAKISYSANNRKIIAPYELDFYLPEKQAAIECNGIWYHSIQAETPIDYHFNKMELCRQRGITLFQVWEDWIKLKWEQTQWMLIKALRLVQENPDNYANAVIKSIPNDIAEKFIKKNGLYQYNYFTKESCHCYGVYLDDILIKVYVGHKFDDEFLLTDIVSVTGHLAYSLNKKVAELIKRELGIKKLYCLSSNDLFDETEYEAFGVQFRYSTNPTFTYIYHNLINESFERIDECLHIEIEFPSEEGLSKYYKCQNAGFRFYE